MSNFDGETIMKIGMVAAALFVIVFIIFYRNDIDSEIRASVYGVVAVIWMSSSVIYSGAIKKITQLKKRIEELESKN